MQYKSWGSWYHSLYTIKQAVICQNCFLEQDTYSLQEFTVTDASTAWGK